MSVLKGHYYKLASEVQLERIQAATNLLSELGKADLKPDWDYALNRLVRGLSSSRQSARFGFSMALAEVVRELVLKDDHDLSIPSFLEKIITSTPVSGSMKGKEVRATLFGRLFGFQALVNSQLLLQERISSDSVLIEFVNAIVELASLKTWLRETAMFTLCQFFAAYLQSALAKEATTVAFLQAISDRKMLFTAEGLAFIMTIPQSDRGRICLAVNTTNQWKHGDPVAKGNLATLALVLKDAEIVDPGDGEGEGEKNPSSEKPASKTIKQKGSWSPRVPFVWDVMLRHFVSEDEVEIADDTTEDAGEGESKKRKKSSSSSGKKKKSKSVLEVESVSLKEFWKVAVDDTLFAEKSSPERKYWGLEILQKFVAAIPSLKVGYLFTPNLLRCLANQSLQSNRLLNKLSTSTIKHIIETAKADVKKVVPCLEAVLKDEEDSGWKFDQMSKSKLCDTLVGILGTYENPEDVSAKTAEKIVRKNQQLLVSQFESALESQEDISTLFREEASKKKTNDAALLWYMDKLLVLFRSTKRYRLDISGPLEDTFKFFLRHAFFKSNKHANVSPYILKVVHDRLQSLLSDFISQKRDGHSWSMYCVKQVGKLEKRDDLELVLQLSDELDEVRSKCYKMLDHIKHTMKSSPETADHQYCFELLFSMNLLLLYMGETEAVGVFEDLDTAYTEIFQEKGKDSDVALLLTEIVLSFVSKRSTLQKKLATMVWESFMCEDNADGKPNVNENCFQLLFNILAATENEEGQQKLFEGEDEFQGEDGSSEDDDSEDEDSEDEDTENDSDDTADDSHDTADAKNNLKAPKPKPKSSGPKLVEAVEQETTKKLAKALGIEQEYDGEVKFEDLGSEDDDQYESESMDDEQMMAIDDELAKIFQERRSALTENSTSNKKSERAAAKEQMLLFKNRVLDLMETFNKVQPNSVYNISFLQPVVTLINTTKDKTLGVKAHKLLKTKFSKSKCSKDEVTKVHETDEEMAAFKQSLLDLIKWFQSDVGARSKNNSHAAACAQSCIVASKWLISFDSEVLPEIIDLYCDTLKTWATNPRNRIQQALFFDFINWLGDKRRQKK